MIHFNSVFAALVAFFVLTSAAQAAHVTLGFFRLDEKVQNSNGKEVDDPFSPAISLGHDWQTPWGQWQFSPRLGYIQNQMVANDSYGGHKVETLYILWDAFHPWQGSSTSGWRVGLGSFMKTIKGPGGTVTVPNGSGTATAYRPDGSSKSATASLNGGFDWVFKDNMGGGILSSLGLTGELFLFETINSKQRLFGYNLSLVGFF